MRTRIAVAAGLIVCAATAASANTGHHDVGGGGGGEAECIRWEPIPVDMAGRDMAIVDMARPELDLGRVDLGRVDLGGVDMRDGGAADMARLVLDPHAGMRCAERASLFDCAFTPSSHDRTNGVALAFLAGIVVFDVVRSRRRARVGRRA